MREKIYPVKLASMNCAENSYIVQRIARIER